MSTDDVITVKFPFLAGVRHGGSFFFFFFFEISFPTPLSLREIRTGYQG